MVCIAAFIVLCLISVFVAILSIFKRDIGKKYWKVFKKSWSCVGKRVTLQKCETGFKDDVKNLLLKKVVVKHPKLVKPLSVTIEVASILIVFVSVWSLVEASKAGLALWTLGTCNVQRPSACSLGAEVCSIDGDAGPQNIIEHVEYWFSDWGEIFGAVPDKFRSWDTEQFDFTGIKLSSDKEGAKSAIDIFDPGCAVCLQSYKKQLASGFLEENNVLLVPFPIKDAEGNYKFKNSRLISAYILATDMQGAPIDSDDSDSEVTPAYKIINRIFMEQDEEHHSYQDIFNNELSEEEAEELLLKWLKEFGYHTAERSEITARAKSEQITEILEKNNNIVVNDIHAKGIPTMIYDNKKHTGRFEEK